MERLPLSRPCYTLQMSLNKPKILDATRYKSSQVANQTRGYYALHLYRTARYYSSPICYDLILANTACSLPIHCAPSCFPPVQCTPLLVYSDQTELLTQNAYCIVSTGKPVLKRGYERPRLWAKDILGIWPLQSGVLIVCKDLI